MPSPVAVCLSWRKFVSKCWHHQLLIMSSAAAVMFPSKTSIASLVLRRSKVRVCRWSTLLAAPHPRTWQGCHYEFTLCTPYQMLAVQSSKALEKPIAIYIHTKKHSFKKPIASFKSNGDMALLLVYLQSDGVCMCVYKYTPW